MPVDFVGHALQPRIVYAPSTLQYSLLLSRRTQYASTYPLRSQLIQKRDAQLRKLERVAPREALNIDGVVRAVHVRIIVAGNGLVGEGGGEAGVVPAGVVGAGVAALGGG